MKKLLFSITLLLFASFLCSQEQTAKSKLEYEKALAKYQEQTDAQIKERMLLIKKINELNAEVKDLQKTKENLHKKYETNQITQRNIRNNLSKFQNEIQSLNAKIQTAITDHNYNRPNTPLGAAKLVPLLKFSSITDFFESLTKEATDASSFIKCEADIIGSDNLVQTQNIVLVGNLGAYSLDQQPALLLLKKDAFSKINDISFNQNDREKLQQPFISGLPFDVTGGAALAIRMEEPDIWQWLENGGPIVYPILFVGLIALFIILIKALSLIGSAGKIATLENQILATAKTGEWQSLQEKLKNKKSMIQTIVFETIQKNLSSKQENEAFIEERIYEHIPRLEKMLPTLNILGVISPLLGLLGTVSGMIATFEIIAVHGSGDPGLMSKGISEALITTQLGLTVAIPVVLVHSLLSSKVENIINDMQLIANSFISSKYPNETQDATNDS